MTKLVEWLSVLAVFGAVWLALITNSIELTLAKQHPTFVLISPLIFVVLFGLYALAVVLYRTFTFNDCEEAAKELQQEIIEAKSGLTKLGFKFQTADVN